MDKKFAGVGLKNIFIIWLVCMLFTLVFRVVFIKYPVDGVTDIALAV